MVVLTVDKNRVSTQEFEPISIGLKGKSDVEMNNKNNILLLIIEKYFLCHNLSTAFMNRLKNYIFFGIFVKV